MSGATPWFEAFRTVLRLQTGVSLDAEKEYVTRSRLAPVARRFGMKTVEDLCLSYVSERRPDVVVAVCDAMMTNETLFFRDRTPFDLFRDELLPELLKARSETRTLRIWCVACATGQEPYSLAMTLEEERRKLSGWTVDILATDISGAALEVAREGVYNQFEVQRGLPVGQLLRSFRKEGERWRIAEHIRERVRFERHNILKDPAPGSRFDVIFCRNLIIYFDESTRRTLMRRLTESLATDGVVIFGATESAIGIGGDLVATPARPWLCRHRRAAAAAPHLRVVAG